MNLKPYGAWPKSIQFLGKNISLYILLLSSIFVLQSCEIVGGIFKAGMLWGIFLVVIIAAAIIYLISRGGRK